MGGSVPPGTMGDDRIFFSKEKHSPGRDILLRKDSRRAGNPILL
jgi:hypothetical protein